ncbi:MAG: hypothetical protein U0325_04640 [Polyangiales bacterium]
MRRACLAGLLLLTTSAHAQPAAPVDLVHHLGLIVQVSSTVGNGRDLPTHLVDGDLNTAWSSRTGELVGAAVSVSLPDDAEVTAIALTAGLTRTVPQDLFRMNPRVARVEIARDGVVLREAALDVDDPGLQTVPVSGRGGRWTVRVRAVRPGSRPAWREVSVSELRVMGRAPARPHGPPQVWIAGASLGRGREAVPVQGPWRDPAGFCASRSTTDPARCRDPYAEGADEGVCGCAEDGASPLGVTRLPAPQGPVRAASVRRVIEDVHGLDPCVLLVETARGAFALPGFATCGEPRIAHDYSVATHVDALAVTPGPDGGATLVARVREVEDRPDVPEAGVRGSRHVRRVTLTVRVSAAGEVVSAVRAGAPR